MRRKEERSKQGQTNNKAKQYSTPKVVTSPKKNELPRVGLEPIALYTLDRALYLYMYSCREQVRFIHAHMLTYVVYMYMYVYLIILGNQFRVFSHLS